MGTNDTPDPAKTDGGKKDRLPSNDPPFVGTTKRRQKLSDLFAYRLHKSELSRDDLVALCSRAEIYLLVLEFELDQSHELFRTFHQELSVCEYLLTRGGDPEITKGLLEYINPSLVKLIELTQKATKSEAGRKAAMASHASGPKTDAKRAVKELWQEWQADPRRYRSVASFARDMLNKFDELRSQPVVEGWAREWKREITLRAK